MNRVFEALRGLFGRRRAPVFCAPDDGGLADAGNLEQALPTLAAVLDLLGEHAFDLDTEAAPAIRDRFAGWARHVGDGAPAPEGGFAAGGARRRDWPAVRSFVAAHRRQEKAFVTRTGKELRDALWMFVQRLSRSFSLDKGVDTRVRVQLKRLKSALDQPSVDRLKQDVADAVDGIRVAIEERTARHREELQATLAELAALREELGRARREANIDPLTQLWNRGCFDERLAEIAAVQALTGRPATLLMIDLDHFKQLNDRHGHPAGDHLLRQVADTLVRALPRKADFIARYGGEEFAVILEGEGAPAARMLAERVLAHVRNLKALWQGQDLKVTVSIGLAEIEEGETAADWLGRADAALYQAKAAGRDRLVESA